MLRCIYKKVMSRINKVAEHMKKATEVTSPLRGTKLRKELHLQLFKDLYDFHEIVIKIGRAELKMTLN